MFCIIQTESKHGLDCCLTLDFLGQCKECSDYQAGKTKPAYPVPAIAYDVMYGSLYVSIWKSRTTKLPCYPVWTSKFFYY